MKKIAWVGLLGSSIGLSTAAAAPTFDIDAVLGAPFPDAPIAAKRAPVIAWSANERGVRNVWIARAPDFVPRKLTTYDRDDGQALSGLQLSADGRWLAYVRGAPSSASGQSLNPANDAAGAERALWLVATDGSGKPTSLPGARGPLFSPSGDALVFSRAGAVGCHPIADPAPKSCTETLLKLPGGNSAVAFSPDGKRLLFGSDRADRAYVGALDLDTRDVRWMAPDFNRDASPVWSPDGKEVAFLRSAGLRNDDKFDLTAADRFEIWRADAASGAARRVFQSGPSAGGYAQFAVEQPLRWSGDGLLFASEESGWLHWYALDGGTARARSRGECEAADLATTEKGALIFSGNCTDIERPQLFAADATRQQRLTRAKDVIETDPVVVAGGEWIALRQADARLPTAIAVVSARGGEARRIFPARLPEDFPQGALVAPKTLTLQAADGVVSHAQLFELARAAGGRKHPALIYVHGGPIRQMLPGWMPMDYYAHDYANNQWLAAQGYVVLSLNYRAGTGYGQAFRRADKQGPRGMSEYQDVLAAQAYLAALPEVDAQRIGIYGGSYGGYLTAQALSRNSDRFAAGVDRHGVHDWRESAKGGDNSGLWGLKPGELELAWQSSPVSHLDGWRSPVLLVHGDDDSAVKFSQSTDLATRLRERKVPIETLVIPGEEHMFLRHASWLEVYRRSAEFFRRHLLEDQR